VRHDGLLGVAGQVVPQVPPAGDLDRVRRAGPGALGAGPGPVPADHPRARAGLQPGRQGRRLPVREQVHDLPGGHVDQDRPADLAAAQREVIDAQDLRRGTGLRVRQGRDQGQERAAVHADAQQPGQPRPGPPGQRQPDLREQPEQRHAAPPVPRRQPGHLLSERPRRAGRILAGEPPHRQPDHHRPAPQRAVLHPAGIPAVHPR
jgi:hypothetical protein